VQLVRSSNAVVVVGEGVDGDSRSRSVDLVSPDSAHGILAKPAVQGCCYLPSSDLDPDPDLDLDPDLRKPAEVHKTSRYPLDEVDVSQSDSPIDRDPLPHSVPKHRVSHQPSQRP
jgi:hypothetical protein